MDMIRSRVGEDFREANVTTSSALNARMDQQQTDGSWTDIDYRINSATSWSPVQHLDRLLDLAATYHTEGHELFESERIRQAVERGLQFWITSNPKSVNWWWNEIGGPKVLAPVLLLMQPVLSESVVQSAIEKLSAEPRLTGQNLIWISDVVILRGLLEQNVDRVSAGVNAIASTIPVTTEEGIQVDGTFYQHGEQLYNGGYGLSYVVDIARWAQYLRGTAYAFQGAESDGLATLILEGTGWMVWKNDIDYSAVGREIVRSNKANSANQLKEPLEQMISVGDAYQSQYQALLDHIVKGDEANQYRVGHKHFWRSDYTINRQKTHMATLRMFSTRTKGGEFINGENRLGFYLPFGATLIYRRGNEYDGIMPQWNWRRIPGTTLEQGIEVVEIASNFGHTSFVGGVTNGKMGISAFDQWRKDWTSNVSARKSWFFFDQGFVAIGADIRCSASNCPTGNTFFTTVNQCRITTQHRGQTLFAKYADGIMNLPDGERTLPQTSWVYHDGIGYVFPKKQDVYVRNLDEIGNWNRINSNSSTASVRGGVLTIGIDHGELNSPADYVYYVLPVGSQEAVTAFVDRNPIRILSNTKSLQAVQHIEARTTGISFYESGELEIEPGLVVTVDTPCLVLVETNHQLSEIEISVSNPLGLEATVKVQVSGYLTGPNVQYLESEGVTEIAFNLPGEAYGGSSVTAMFTVVPDLDQDNLPDQWERAYFNTLSYGGTDDYDDDRYSDAHEFIAGTSPLDRFDYPRMAIDVDHSGLTYLSFEAKAYTESEQARYYQVEGRKEDSMEWSILDGYDRILGENQSLGIQFNVISYDFYRLNVWLE